MTAKEKLAEQVERFTEEEAREALLLLALDSGDWPDFPPASPRTMELFRHALADSEAGRVIADEELDRRFGPA